jgi:hypothetical protein
VNEEGFDALETCEPAWKELGDYRRYRLRKKTHELSRIQHDVLSGDLKMTVCCCQGGPFNGNGAGDEIKTGSVVIFLRKPVDEASISNLTEGDVYSVVTQLVGGKVKEALTQEMIRSRSIYGFCSMVNWFLF